MVEIGSNIKEYRKKKGMTQKQLAEKLNISPVNVSQIEKGHRIPRVDTIRKIAEALDTSWLMLVTADSLDDLDEDMKAAMYNEMLPIRDQSLYTRLIEAFDRLNNEGQEKAVERLEELASIPKYQNFGVF